MLDDALLKRLVEEYDSPDVTAIGLSGSYARNDANRYSDVDLVRYVRADANAGFLARYAAGLLVTVTSVTIAQKRAEMYRPGSAIWVVSALRRMRILLDKEGTLAEFQREAESFEWDTAKAAADASKNVAEYAEEVHKLLAAFLRDDAPALAYVTMGMTLGMTHNMAVAHNLLISTEGAYFREVGTAVGSNSAWTQQLRRALGLDAEPSSVKTRALAALRLYRETTRLLEPILRPEDLAVVQECSMILDQHTIGE